MKPDANQPKAPEANPGPKPDAKLDAKDDLKSLPMPEVEKRLGSSPDGLSQAEAQKRLTQYGPNEIKEEKTNPFLKFLTYFWGPIPWMIEVAVILSGVVGHWEDFGIILFLLLCNAVVGFWEERQAGNAIDALKARLAIKARVKRDGKWITPAARELVPGDVIRVRLGDIVPADARLLDGDPVAVDQSALTGESLPAERKSGDAVFSGSIIRQGEIGAMVYATGDKTYFGKTAQLVQEAHTVSHFQQAVLKIGKYLIILAVALVAVIIAVGSACMCRARMRFHFSMSSLPASSSLGSTGCCAVSLWPRAWRCRTVGRFIPRTVLMQETPPGSSRRCPTSGGNVFGGVFLVDRSHGRGNWQDTRVAHGSRPACWTGASASRGCDHLAGRGGNS